MGKGCVMHAGTYDVPARKQARPQPAQASKLPARGTSGWTCPASAAMLVPIEQDEQLEASKYVLQERSPGDVQAVQQNDRCQTKRGTDTHRREQRSRGGGMCIRKRRGSTQRR